MDPAVGVHHVAGDVVDHAVDGVAHILPGRHQQRRDEEQPDGDLVVQSEYLVVDPYGIELQEAHGLLEHAQHLEGVGWGTGLVMRSK